MLNDEVRNEPETAGTGVPFPSSRIDLPSVPAAQSDLSVACWVEPLIIDSYLPDEPDDLPAFLEQRVYQGSSGRVYPLPFHERISQSKVPHSWNAVHIENEWLRVVILPELGGRVHIAYDKVAEYDFVYRNNVIKPALVGLAGPWIAGGIEFNWPQHHRPTTFLPVDFEIEREPDGSVTVWCSDHDPFTRMKGMHGIRLSPDSSVLEARVRLYNRSEETQSFLWWANVAAAVNDNYQSFFPTDVHEVADHARRAIATFPEVEGVYYGIDYPSRVTDDRPEANRLDWYRNIPVPTSYMVLESEDDFFGGYDHGREAGFVHWADHRFVAGKKQWTWGNAPFGWAWDRNLTDTDGAYIELMAGAFTNNQPDFSFLAPGETKTFSQYWYPIHGTGIVQQANSDCAVSLNVRHETSATTNVELTIAVTSLFDSTEVAVHVAEGEILLRSAGPHSPRTPVTVTGRVNRHVEAADLIIDITGDGVELLHWTPRADDSVATELNPASEPPEPEAVANSDELFLIGQYLLQYRHATRMPEPYWLEAIHRDPGDARSNTALAGRAAWAGDLAAAERYLRTAINRQTNRVPNPSDGEAHYLMGIVLVRQGSDAEAKDYLAKAMWNAAWRVPAGLALARLEARAGNQRDAISRAREVLLLDADNLQGRDILAALFRAGGDVVSARHLLMKTLVFDPLDQWARDLMGWTTSEDAGTLLDVALEYASCGMTDDALRVLDHAAEAARSTAPGQVQVAPLIHFHRAWILDALGHRAEAGEARSAAIASDDRHCLASRPEDLHALLLAIQSEPDSGLAHVLLGNWFYDKRLYEDAQRHWARSLDCALPSHLEAMTHRNLGIAAFNVTHDTVASREHYARATSLEPSNAKLLYESDQLAQRLGDDPESRVERLSRNSRLLATRDDLTVAFANLLTKLDRAGEAHALVSARVFQPWEGGEGMVLDAWDQANFALARSALASAEPQRALEYVNSSLVTPSSLGEARHALANASELHLLRGDILHELGDREGATDAWKQAAAFTGDFLQMSSQPFSIQTYHSVVALQRLGRSREAIEKADLLASWVDELARTPAGINYFATSLPSMLLFHTDPQRERDAEVATIRSQLAMLGSTLPIMTAP